MSPRTAVLRGRNAVDRLLVDYGQISRSGAAVFNPDTGLSVATSTVVYSGLCRMRQPTAVEDELQFGDEQVTASRFMACFPHDVTGVQIDDVVTVTETDDPDLIGRSFRVLAVPMNTFTLYKAFPTEMVE